MLHLHGKLSFFFFFTLMVCLFEGVLKEIMGVQAPLSTVLSVPPTAGHDSVSGETNWWDRLALKGKGAVQKRKCPSGMF